MRTLTINKGLTVDGKILTFTDATATYGTSLPERDSVALLPYVYYQPADQTQPRVVMTPSAYSPIDVVTFSFDVENVVAVVIGYFFIVPLYSGGVLNEGDIVYNTTTNRLEQVIDSVLTPIDVSTLVDNDDINSGYQTAKIDVAVSKLQNQYLLTVLTKQKQAEAHICEIDEYNQAQFNYDLIVNERAAAHIAYCGGALDVAQDHLETVYAFAKKLLNVA